MVDLDIYNVVLFQTMHNFLPPESTHSTKVPKHVNKYKIEHQFMPKIDFLQLTN